MDHQGEQVLDQNQREPKAPILDNPVENLLVAVIEVFDALIKGYDAPEEHSRY